MIELVSAYLVTISSVVRLEFPSVSLALSFLMRLRLTTPLLSWLSLSQPLRVPPQLSPSQTLRALPSAVEPCRLVGE